MEAETKTVHEIQSMRNRLQRIRPVVETSTLELGIRYLIPKRLQRVKEKAISRRTHCNHSNSSACNPHNGTQDKYCTHGISGTSGTSTRCRPISAAAQVLAMLPVLPGICPRVRACGRKTQLCHRPSPHSHCTNSPHLRGHQHDLQQPGTRFLSAAAAQFCDRWLASMFRSCNAGTTARGSRRNNIAALCCILQRQGVRGCTCVVD